jgi:hypothetical protein
MNNIEHLLVDIPLNFEKQVYADIFKDKNNKTLKETLETSKYKPLTDKVNQNYPQELNTNLGEFLKKLKKDGDAFYKEFLNKYGDLEYSIFSLANKEQYNLKGVYFYYLNNELKYIGRCRDSMQKRVNSRYGKISPKNCFKDGQSTNCKVNAFVTKYREDIELKIFVMDDVKEIEELESRLILEFEPEWNGRK